MALEWQSGRAGARPTSSAALFARAEAARSAAGDLCADGVRAARRNVSLTLAAVDSAPVDACHVMTILARDAGATPDEIDAVRTITCELVANAVHAYDTASGEVAVDAAVIGHGLVVIISDDGRGLATASRRPGVGLGWRVVSQLADQFTIIRRPNGGTQAHVRMRLSRTASVPSV